MVDFAPGRLVFLVGAPRSGTSYLQRVLACHPQILTGQESHLLRYIGPPARVWHHQLERLGTDSRGGVGLPCYLTEGQFENWLAHSASALLDEVLPDLHSDEIFVDKTPGHALWTAEIARLFPRSKVIHLLRDGRDVVASLLAASRSWGRSWAPSSVLEASRVWKKHVHSARQFRTHSSSAPYLEVRFEDLRRNPEESVRRTIEFLELEWRPSALTQALSANSLSEARSTGGSTISLRGAARELGHVAVAEPRGFVRQGQVGGWRTELSVLQRSLLWVDCHRSLARFGYHWPTPFHG